MRIGFWFQGGNQPGSLTPADSKVHVEGARYGGHITRAGLSKIAFGQELLCGYYTFPTCYALLLIESRKLGHFF